MTSPDSRSPTALHVLGEPLVVSRVGPARWHKATVKGFFRVSIRHAGEEFSAWIRGPRGKAILYIRADPKTFGDGIAPDAAVGWLAGLCEWWIANRFEKTA